MRVLRLQHLHRERARPEREPRRLRRQRADGAAAGPRRAAPGSGPAGAAGFEHVNLDLIYGAPYETEADWQASLDAAVGAEPDHLSAYALVVEKGTALARQVAQGVVPAPDDDVLADRYAQADATLSKV